MNQIENTTFLRIRFDVQTQFLQKSCINRLNFLKVVSKRRFGLAIETLNQLYTSLIRSILEYSAIISPIISPSNYGKINIIQNKAIKIINKKSIYSNLSEIETSIKDLMVRFDNLNVKYLKKALDSNNELIQELWSDYKSYTTNSAIRNQTILCKYKNLI